MYAKSDLMNHISRLGIKSTDTLLIHSSMKSIGEVEKWDTPCSRMGCWGKLYDRKAKILFLGCSLKSNTLLHGVEEWNYISERLTDKYRQYKILTPEGKLIERPMRGHFNPADDVSKNYDKMLEPFIHMGIGQKGLIGDAESVLCDVVGMVDLTSEFLKRNSDLFLDDSPVPDEWYRE